jgi:hypothetical protein
MKKTLSLSIFALLFFGAFISFSFLPEKSFAEENFLDNCEQLEVSNYKVCREGVNEGVFYYEAKVEGVDVESFEGLIDGFNSLGIDKNNVYLNGEILKDLNPDFEIVISMWHNTYFKDSKTVYLNNKKILNADSETFKVLPFGESNYGPYATDKNHVYSKTKIIEGVDSSTFKNLGWGFFADKNGVYNQGEQIKGMDSKNLKTIECNCSETICYILSEEKIYDTTQHKIIEGFDVKSFSPLYGKYIGGCERDSYIKDKNNYYKHGKIISFEDLPWSIQEEEKKEQKQKIQQTHLKSELSQILPEKMGNEGFVWIGDTKFLSFYETLNDLLVKKEFSGGKYFAGILNTWYFSDSIFSQKIKLPKRYVEAWKFSQNKNLLQKFLKNSVIEKNVLSEEKTEFVITYNSTLNKIISGNPELEKLRDSVMYKNEAGQKSVFFSQLFEKKIDSVVLEYNPKQNFLEKITIKIGDEEINLEYTNNDFDKQDPKNIDLEYVEWRFFKDQKNAYHNYGNLNILNSVDASSFKVIDDWYFKDKNNVYSKINGEIKKHSYDLESFKALEGFYTKDKNGAYWNNKKIENADTQTFESFNWSYSKDKNYIYCRGKKIEGADPNTFEVLKNDYSKDKKNAYYNDSEISWADTESFEVLPYFFAKDKNNIYLYGQAKNFDVNTFKVLSRNYVQSNNSIYTNFRFNFSKKENLRNNHFISRKEFLLYLLYISEKEVSYKQLGEDFDTSGYSFLDIENKLEWKNISYMAYSKIISSNPENKFYPDRTINFAEASKILVNTFFEITPEKKADDWWIPFVEKLEKEGIKTFPPQKELTGDDMVDLFLDVLEWQEQQKK